MFGKGVDPKVGKSTQFKKGCNHNPTGLHGESEDARKVASIRKVLFALVPEKEMKRRWKFFLDNSNTDIKWTAFKLALYYMYGRPPKRPINPDDQAESNMGEAFDFSDFPTGNTPIQ